MQNKGVNVYQPEDALSSLFEQYAPVIFALLRSHVPSREEAEDILAEVFMSALQHPEIMQWDGPRALYWLKRVAYYKVVDSYRLKQRYRTITLATFTNEIHDERDPESIFLHQEVYNELYDSIQRLSIKQQQLLFLRYGCNLATAEIAVFLNRSDQSVRKQLSRTIQQLRRIHQARQKGE
uniref:DNA-directed RNA polymerase sigma-70 factor n=1 Tax=Thermosporothrix sp. COM3 TaxID=2490863 RepID=A0A455SLT9_9CHLR|nr:hypothetical protein KTC_26900 [Thermosporothrix sp. COM3]